MASMSRKVSMTSRAGTTTRVSSRRGRGHFIAVGGGRTSRGVGRGAGNKGGKLR